MLLEPRTTWSLVRISPDDVTMSPVPAALPPPARVVLMLTIAGVTLAATADALRLPFEDPPGWGWIGASDGVVTAAERGASITRARLHPMPAPADAAMTPTSTTAAAARCQKDGAGGAGGAGGIHVGGATGSGCRVDDSKGAGAGSDGVGFSSVMSAIRMAGKPLRNLAGCLEMPEKQETTRPYEALSTSVAKSGSDWPPLTRSRPHTKRPSIDRQNPYLVVVAS